MFLEKSKLGVGWGVVVGRGGKEGGRGGKEGGGGGKEGGVLS